MHRHLLWSDGRMREFRPLLSTQALNWHGVKEAMTWHALKAQDRTAVSPWVSESSESNTWLPHLVVQHATSRLTVPPLTCGSRGFAAAQPMFYCFFFPYPPGEGGGSISHRDLAVNPLWVCISHFEVAVTFSWDQPISSPCSGSCDLTVISLLTSWWDIQVSPLWVWC